MFFPKQTDDIKMNVPSASISINHDLKLVVMEVEHFADPSSFDDLVLHLRKQGYHIHVFLPTASGDSEVSR